MFVVVVGDDDYNDFANFMVGLIICINIMIGLHVISIIPHFVATNSALQIGSRIHLVSLLFGVTLTGTSEGRYWMKPIHVEPKRSELTVPLATTLATPGMFDSSWNLKSAIRTLFMWGLIELHYGFLFI